MHSLHTRSVLQHEMTDIQQDILRLGSMVEQAIGRSIQALKERDAGLAQQVIDDDKHINQLRYAIEEACLVTIATQQPAAGDLRTLIAAMHIAGELERMADHAEGVAALTLRMIDQPLLKPLIDVPRMAIICQEMIHASLDAYIKQDAELAKQVAARDDELDVLYEQVFRELLTYMIEDPKNISRATFLLWVTHNLERTGDRVTNVCERVIFMTTGQLGEIKGQHLEKWSVESGEREE
ncbi:MAG: phosphate signaling complex protein PhoU [Thermoflexales bacterium]|nr:phosphate signaling complex protein PhoU [Thermoflexales bacterium]